MENKRNQRVADVASIERFEPHFGVWLSHAGAAFYDRYKEDLQQIEMKPSWVTALAFIESSPGMAQSELGRSMAINRASAMALASALEKAGLVTREKGGVKNQSSLYLSALGAEKLNAACDLEIGISRQLMADFSEADTKLLLNLFKSVTEKLNQ